MQQRIVGLTPSLLSADRGEAMRLSYWTVVIREGGIDASQLLQAQRSIPWK